MRSAKSIPSLSNNNIINNHHRNQQLQQQQQHRQMASQSPTSNVSNWTTGKASNGIHKQPASAAGPTSPICRCRVMYLGSSVPLITKDGLQGIQEPLRKLYPDRASLDSGSAGIDSWLSVWSNGILIENVDENGREMKRFFKIGALHYCAAVKYIPSNIFQQAMYSCSTLPHNPSAMMQQQQQLNGSSMPGFLPLDSPYARLVDSSPPIFASILRRTTGIKVLECHAFICKREAAANALVRCCFHAYADTMYAKQIGADVHSPADETNDNSGASFQETEHDFGASQEQDNHQNNQHHNQQHSNSNNNNNEPSRLIARNRSKSIAALNESSNQDMESSYRGSKTNDPTNYYSNSGDPEYCSLADNQHLDSYSMSERKSSTEAPFPARDELDMNGNHTNGNTNLKKQQLKHLSKSMHYLNYQNGGAPIANYGTGFTNPPMLMNDAYGPMINTAVGGVNCFNGNNPWATKQSSPAQQPFYNNPYASRVPSYPPQEQMESTNGGGTLKSIRSMAANSIASTLLRSKRHAKSMAQLNKDNVISFHQPQANHMSSAHTMMGPVMLPPVPAMFLPNLPLGSNGRALVNGSQTMKLPSRSMVPMLSQPINFEAMTPKEMKKLLKKSAKYGVNPNHLPPIEHSLPPMLPLPRQPPSVASHHHLIQNCDGTLPLRPPSIYSDVFNGSGYTDMPPDMLHASVHGLPPPPPSIEQQQQMAPILVKPNQEFLKSKAGKKWLKQQKEFKKLLPPHLDGLPIIFGPPPPDALEPSGVPPPPPPPLPPSHGRNIPSCDSIDNRHRIYY